MLEIADKVEFQVSCDSAKFITTANGDNLVLDNFDLDSLTTASLAWLVNQDPGTPLLIEIKVAP